MCCMLVLQYYYRDKPNRLLQSDTVTFQENIALQLLLQGLVTQTGLLIAQLVEFLGLLG